MFGYLLLALLPVSALVYVIWSYRKRAAARAAASARRFAETFGAATHRTGLPAATAAAVREPASAPLCLAKAAVLDAKHAALFHALSSSLPEFHVFPHVSLAAVVQLPPGVQGREREQRLRAIAQNAVDCLVCDRDARVIAAIDREDGSDEYRVKAAWLAAAGLRYVRLDPGALPAADEIRNTIVSGAGAKSS